MQAATSHFGQARHPYTRGLLSCVPVPGRTAPGSRLGTIAGTVPSLVGQRLGCAFRERCAIAVAACAGPIAPTSVSGHRWRCIVDGSGPVRP